MTSLTAAHNLNGHGGGPGGPGYDESETGGGGNGYTAASPGYGGQGYGMGNMGGMGMNVGNMPGPSTQNSSSQPPHPPPPPSTSQPYAQRQYPNSTPGFEHLTSGGASAQGGSNPQQQPQPQQPPQMYMSTSGQNHPYAHPGFNMTPGQTVGPSYSHQTLPQHIQHPLQPPSTALPTYAAMSNGSMPMPMSMSMSMPMPSTAYSFGHPPPPLPLQRGPPRDLWPGHPEWEDGGEYGDGGDMMYGQLEVKHRRRTTPEQLKVLEHWFDINAKPDNNLREWLAMELGMTKRNVQVWFQNRRAKVKNNHLKEKAAAAKAANTTDSAPTNPDALRTPENKSTSPPNAASSKTGQSSGHPRPPTVTESHATPSPPGPKANAPPSREFAMPARPPALQLHSQPEIALLSPVNGLNMGRRASLANGEAAKIESFMAKQRLLARKANGHAMGPSSGFVSPVRSPVIGQNQANMARRSSIPYPSPIDTASANLILNGGGASPKNSPSVRPASTALHLAAIRNNSRRASMPGVAGLPNVPGAQLICSGPFTPPRVVSAGAVVNGQQMPIRELSPIKDQDGGSGNAGEMQNGMNNGLPDGYLFSDPTDLSTTFLTPPSSTYMANNTSPNGYMNTDSSVSTSGSGMYDYTSSSGASHIPPYTPLGTLPQPGFSFGSANQNQSNVSGPGSGSGSEGMMGDMYGNQFGGNNNGFMDMQAMQPRGRLGSIASIGTYTTEGTAGEGGSVDWDWTGMGGMAPLVGDMEGFDPDTRRASAPADLLHELGILGINPNFVNSTSTPLRPSPLGAHFAHDQLDMTQFQQGGYQDQNGFNVDALTQNYSEGGYQFGTAETAGTGGTGATNDPSPDSGASNGANTNGSSPTHPGQNQQGQGQKAEQ